ncbi:unnamed protein product [Didymodactylos carnosus]|nr:unnamed protein product [Didymodactylos carnosus]CAF4158623.1 unnamed protein product [Didymodactylos carnosus]
MTSNYSNVLLDNLDILATCASGLFAGASLYINLAQVPSLNASLSTDEHWKYFPSMLKCAAPSQSILAFTSGIFSLMHAYRMPQNFPNIWYTAGILMSLIVPYTSLAIMPTNNLIMDSVDSTKATTKVYTSAEKKKHLGKWATLHTPRTVATLAAFGLMIYGLKNK